MGVLSGCAIAFVVHSLEGSTIALLIQSLDPSLTTQLIAPTSGFGRFTGTDSLVEESIVVQMRSQSNRSWYGNLSPSG